MTGDKRATGQDQVTRSSMFPEFVVAIGALVAISGMSLPQWASSYPPVGFARSAGSLMSLDAYVLGGASKNIAVNGFSDWGMAYLVVWFAVVSLLFVRTFRVVGLRTVELPLKNGLAYTIAGALMVLCSLIVWSSLHLGGMVRPTMQVGWWLSLAGAFVILVGGELKRRGEVLHGP